MDVLGGLLHELAEVNKGGGGRWFAGCLVTTTLNDGSAIPASLC